MSWISFVFTWLQSLVLPLVQTVSAVGRGIVRAVLSLLTKLYTDHMINFIQCCPISIKYLQTMLLFHLGKTFLKTTFVLTFSCVSSLNIQAHVNTTYPLMFVTDFDFTRRGRCCCSSASVNQRCVNKICGSKFLTL